MYKKNHYAYLVRITIVTVLLIAAVSWIDIETLCDYFNKDILVAVAVWHLFVPVVVIPFSYRLAIFARTPAVSFAVALKSIFLATGFNVILPGRLSEFAKPLFLLKKENVPISNGLGAIFAERIIDMALLAIFAGIVLCKTYIQLSYPIIITLFAISIAVFLTSLFFHSIILKFITFIPFSPAKRFLENMFSYALKLFRFRRFYVGFALGVSGWLGATYCYYVFFRIAGSIPLNYFEAMAVFVAISMAYAIPALPAGIGVFEASAVFAMMTFGYTGEESLALAVVLHLCTLIAPLLITIWILVLEDIKLAEWIGNLRKMMEEHSRN